MVWSTKLSSLPCPSRFTSECRSHISWNRECFHPHWWMFSVADFLHCALCWHKLVMFLFFLQVSGSQLRQVQARAKRWNMTLPTYPRNWLTTVRHCPCQTPLIIFPYLPNLKISVNLTTCLWRWGEPVSVRF